MAQASVEKQIKAAQKFLGALRALPTFEELKEKQLVSLLKVVEKCPPIPTDKVANLLSLLDSDIWGSAFERLQEKLTEKLVEESVTYRALQDWTLLPYCLDEKMWNLLTTCSKPMQALEQLTKYCGRLGLRCPTEFTYGGLLTLSHCTFGRTYTDPEKKRLLDQQKSNIKKWLSGFPDPSVYMVELPMEMDKLPESVLQSVFPNGYQVKIPPGVDVPSLIHMIRQYPVRRTNARVQTTDFRGSSADTLPSVDASLQAVGSLMRGLLVPGQNTQAHGSGIAEEPGRPAPLALMDKTDDVVVEAENTKTDSSHSLVSQSALEVAETQDKKDVKGSVQSSLAKLREAVEPKKPVGSNLEDGSEPEERVSFKRPAARGRPRKRPAAAEAESLSPASSTQSVAVSRKRKGPAKVMKQVRKAPKAAAKKKKKQDDAKAKTKRERLAQIVPKTILRKFKDGCQRCRNTPYCCSSCWRIRGFEV